MDFSFLISFAKELKELYVEKVDHSIVYVSAHMHEQQNMLCAFVPALLEIIIKTIFKNMKSDSSNTFSLFVIKTSRFAQTQTVDIQKC